MGNRKAWKIGVSILAMIALGLTSRYVPIGVRFWDLDLGDIVSGAAIYFVMAFVFRKAPVGRLVIFACLCCVAIECFKLTGIPFRVRGIAPLRWCLGTTFSFHNLPLYLIGIVAAATWDRVWIGKPS